MCRLNVRRSLGHHDGYHSGLLVGLVLRMWPSELQIVRALFDLDDMRCDISFADIGWPGKVRGEHFELSASLVVSFILGAYRLQDVQVMCCGTHVVVAQASLHISRVHARGVPGVASGRHVVSACVLHTFIIPAFKCWF
jgi:hypothetical protein